MERTRKPTYLHYEEVKLMPHEIEMVEAFARKKTGCPDCKVVCYGYKHRLPLTFCVYVACKIMSHGGTKRERNAVVCVMLDDRSRSNVPENQWKPGVTLCDGIPADPNEEKEKENRAIQETQNVITQRKERIAMNPASRTYEFSAAEQWLIDLFRSCADMEQEILMDNACTLHHTMNKRGML